MASLTKTLAWKALAAHRDANSGVHMRDLFDEDPRRFERFSLLLDDVLLDFSKNQITEETIPLLLNLARQEDVEGWRDAMFRGDPINGTEGRAALHVALRDRGSRRIQVNGEDVAPGIRNVLDQMRRFSDAVRNGTRKGFSGKAITDVVNIGIGGSDLGPAMACRALTPYAKPDLNVHFLSNVDGTDFAETLKHLRAETTFFIIASKTFTTQETMANAVAARNWLTDVAGDEPISGHFAAVSANAAVAAEFGVDPANIFPIWDWVGGRYSLWSAVGLPIALSIGMDNFEALLDGGHALDEHFQTAPLAENLPVILALVGIWNSNFLGAAAHAVLPYDQYLAQFPAYLQQLDMESNGKTVDRDGGAIDYETGPVIFGEPGTNGQHAFYQLIHQGSPMVSADFIAPVETQNKIDGHHEILLSNYFAQTEALMKGKTEAEAREELAADGLHGEELERLLPHKVFAGNKPTNSILVRRIDPRTLGMLIALYEHKIFVQGVIWRVNPFDQWGVELGKRLATAILGELDGGGETSAHDSSTNGLINRYKKLRTETP